MQKKGIHCWKLFWVENFIITYFTTKFVDMLSKIQRKLVPSHYSIMYNPVIIYIIYIYFLYSSLPSNNPCISIVSIYSY